MTAARPDLLGAHVSTQGGPHTAFQRGIDIGATAIQLFTKTPNQWREPVATAEVQDAFRRAADACSGLGALVSHDSYLINLASPDDTLRARSLASFEAELTRCTALRIPYLVSHPGNFMDDHDAGVERNAVSITRGLRTVPGDTMLLLETTAGTGTSLGRTFEELATIRELVADDVRHRIGFCADTCHLHSAGYDLVNDFEGVWASWERILGFDSLKVLHLNDSKTPFGSHRDRHELIAEGSIGPVPFRRIMTDPRFADVVKVLETPKGDDGVSEDIRMLRRLRRYARGPRPAAAGRARAQN